MKRKSVGRLSAAFVFFMLVVNLLMMNSVSADDTITADVFYTNFDDAGIGNSTYNNSWLEFNQTEGNFTYRGVSPLYGKSFYSRAAPGLHDLNMNLTYNASQQVIGCTVRFNISYALNNDIYLKFNEVGGNTPVYFGMVFLADQVRFHVIRAGAGNVVIGNSSYFNTTVWTNDKDWMLGWYRNWNDDVTYFAMLGNETIETTLDDDALYQVGDARIDQIQFKAYTAHINVTAVKIVVGDEYFADAYLNPDGSLKTLGTDHYSRRRDFPNDFQAAGISFSGTGDDNAFSMQYYFPDATSGIPSVLHCLIYGVDMINGGTLTQTEVQSMLNLHVYIYQDRWYAAGEPAEVEWTGYYVTSGVPLYEVVWHDLGNYVREFEFNNDGYVQFLVWVNNNNPHVFGTVRGGVPDYDGDNLWYWLPTWQIEDNVPSLGNQIKDISRDPCWYWGWDDYGVEVESWNVEMPSSTSWDSGDNREIGFIRNSGSESAFWQIVLPSGDVFDEGYITNDMKYPFLVPNNGGTGAGYIRIGTDYTMTTLFDNESYTISTIETGSWGLNVLTPKVVHGGKLKFEYKAPQGYNGEVKLKAAGDGTSWRVEIPISGNNNWRIKEVTMKTSWPDGDWYCVLYNNTGGVTNTTSFEVTQQESFEILSISPLNGTLGTNFEIVYQCTYTGNLYLRVQHKDAVETYIDIPIVSESQTKVFVTPTQLGEYVCKLYRDDVLMFTDDTTFVVSPKPDPTPPIPRNDTDVDSYVGIPVATWYGAIGGIIVLGAAFVPVAFGAKHHYHVDPIIVLLFGVFGLVLAVFLGLWPLWVVYVFVLLIVAYFVYYLMRG